MIESWRFHFYNRDRATVTRLRYLVQPKMAGRVKMRFIKRLLAKLYAEPGRALFPKGNMR